MGLLDEKLADGQSQPLNRAWYNALVEKLRELSEANELQVEPSTNRAVVHPAAEENFPLQPNMVSLQDVTNWGLPADAQLRVRWELVSGPGHLQTGPTGSPTQTTTTGANEAVYWNWSNENDTGFDTVYYTGRIDRQWNATYEGNSLPAVVQVRAVAETQLTDGTWSEVSETTTHVVVERAYDPSIQPGVSPRIEPDQDVAYLSADGTAVVRFSDFSTFTGETSVKRTVHAHMKRGDGQFVEVTGSYIDGTANIVGADDAAMAFECEAKTAGLLVVELDYDTGGEVKHITRSVTIRPVLETQLGATTDPALPPISVDPGKGMVTIEAGQDVALRTIVDEGPVYDQDNGMQWVNERSQELARRLGVDEVQGDNPQLDMLYEAGATLVAVLQQSTDSGLRRYAVEIQRGVATEDQVLQLERGAIRLTERTAQGEDFETFQGIGVVEPDSLEDTNEGRIIANGDRVDMDVQLAYGKATNASFPDEMHHRSVTLYPHQRAQTITLPQAHPEEVGDRWYMRHQATARWATGKEVSTRWTDWKEADRLPEGTAQATLTAENRAAILQIESEGRVRGVTKWSSQGQSPISDEEVLRSDYLPTTTDTYPAPSVWEDATQPPHLHVRLLQSTPAGSTRGQIEAYDLRLPDAVRQVLPVTPVQGNVIPPDMPVIPGMIIEGSTRTWLGVSDGYMPLSSGSFGLIDYINLAVDNETPAAITKLSPAAFEGSVQAFEADYVQLHLGTKGAVDRVELISNDMPFLRPRTSPTYKPNEGHFEQVFVIPRDAQGAESELLYRLMAGDDEQLVRVTLENTNVSLDSGPAIESIDPLLVTSSGRLATATGTQPEITTTVDTSGAVETWRLSSMAATPTWEGAQLVIKAPRTSAATIVGSGGTQDGVDVADFNINRDLRVDRSARTPSIYVTLDHDKFDTVDESFIELQLKQNDNASATKTIRIEFAYTNVTNQV